jgi:hypothetical protein
MRRDAVAYVFAAGAKKPIFSKRLSVVYRQGVILCLQSS